MPAVFFTPQTLLMEDVPFEHYGAHDLNLGDPYVEVRCGTRSVEPTAGKRPSCKGGQVPRGRLSVRAALSEGDSRVTRHCQQRLWLASHLDAKGQKAFQSAIVDCNAVAGSAAP